MNYVLLWKRKKGGRLPPFGIRNLAMILEQFHALDPSSASLAGEKRWLLLSEHAM